MRRESVVSKNQGRGCNYLAVSVRRERVKLLIWSNMAALKPSISRHSFSLHSAADATAGDRVELDSCFLLHNEHTEKWLKENVEVPANRNCKNVAVTRIYPGGTALS